MVQESPPLLRCALSGVTVFGVMALLLGASDAAELAAFHGWGKLGLDWLELEAWSRQRPFVPAGVLGALFAALMLLCTHQWTYHGVLAPASSWREAVVGGGKKARGRWREKPTLKHLSALRSSREGTSGRRSTFQ